MLVRLLADIFLTHVDRPAAVTWHEHRHQYEGQFFNLVNEVLQVTRELTHQWDRPFSAPVRNQALGKYVERVLANMDRAQPERA
jgi:hypothetical protein